MEIEIDRYEINMKWSLRTKILSVLSALLLGVVFAYLVLANKVFREDKELLVFDTNKFNTERVANELDNAVKRVVDKMEIISELMINEEGSRQSLAKSIFEADQDLIVLQLVSASEDGKSLRMIRDMVDANQIASMKISVENVLSQLPKTLAGTSTQSIQVENKSLSNSILYLMQVPVRMNSNLGKHLFVRAIINGRSWNEIFESTQSLAQTFAVSADGKVFAHPDPSLVMAQKDMNDLEIVRAARSQSFSLFQSEFESNRKNYLGVSRKTFMGSITVISLTEKGMALAASRLLLEKTITLSLIIITIVFMIALFFANSLSRPILRLVRATDELARGNFDANLEVEGNDEIGTLSLGFSNMAKELKSSHLLLEDYSRRLEIKVQERTQELEGKNVAIREQQEVLLKTTRLAAVGEIAGQAAHEVLNPLTAMVSRLEAMTHRLAQFATEQNAPLPIFSAITSSWNKELTEKGLDAWLASIRKSSHVVPNKMLIEEDLQNLNTIEAEFSRFSRQLGDDFKLLLSESHRISRIVDGMRGLSRSTKIKRKSDIIQIIRECVQVSEDMLRRYRIEIKTLFQESPIFALIESDEMKQVFSNLIKNSMDAIEESRKFQSDNLIKGLVIIKVLSDKDHIKISFWDNGRGVSPADQQKVFDSQYSTKGEAGTGFGLSICRRFVRDCGGELTIASSKVGEYTEFEITLPKTLLSEGLKNAST